MATAAKKNKDGTERKKPEPRPVTLIYSIEDADGELISGANLVVHRATRNAAEALKALASAKGDYALLNVD